MDHQADPVCQHLRPPDSNGQGRHMSQSPFYISCVLSLGNKNSAITILINSRRSQGA